MSRALAAPGPGAPPPVEAGGWTRGERTALGVALAAHLVLFTLLSMATGPQPPRLWPKNPPIEVSLVRDIAPEATAPPAPEPPAPSVAPETGEPEDAAPAPPPEPVAKPEPVKPAPPKPASARPAPVKPEPAKPAPKPVPAAKPAPTKPAPAKTTPAAKPAPTTAKSAAAARPTARPSRLTGLASSLSAGAKADATAPRQRGHRLGDDILAGLSPDAPAKKASAAAPGKAGPFPAASIVGAIARQIQPCADRQVNPGPGASRIVTTLNVRLNRDGTLAGAPRMVRQAGVDDENGRYAQRVVDLGIAAFKGCTPLHLPAEYYDTAGGGWSNLNYRWQLR